LVTGIWIAGGSRCGKTSRLVSEFQQWVKKQQRKQKRSKNPASLTAAVLVLAATEEEKRKLGDRLAASIEGNFPFNVKTPLGFIAEEVRLFYPLLFKKLNLKAQFPLRLRPETEQDLATKLWRERLQSAAIQTTESEYRLVRRILDLLQLAGASGVPIEAIPDVLERGLPEAQRQTQLVLNPKEIGALLWEWRDWCWQRGLLSYGIVYELYWRYLLPDSQYQSQLFRRYQGIFGDDADDYPAIVENLFDLFHNRQLPTVFTYNTDGKIRLGLNADPDYIETISLQCQCETLTQIPNISLAGDVADRVVNLVSESIVLETLPDSIVSIQTISRAELLKQTCETIIAAIRDKTIEPREIAVIAPGLDEISRYNIMRLLVEAGIDVLPSNEQRPLIASTVVRSLLTLAAFVYPHLGRSIDRDSVAEMLVTLTDVEIDPVRAGMIADACYHIDPDRPRLLSVADSFSRWDRLGYRATQAYEDILVWIEKMAIEREKKPDFPNFLEFIDLASQHFFNRPEILTQKSHILPFAHLSALRELKETAQHYWEVEKRLLLDGTTEKDAAIIAQFVQLLRRGTIAANPYPIGSLKTKTNAVILGNIFQYRALRGCHRWQFWLDIASPFWDKGGAATLVGAPLFLKQWSGGVWDADDEYNCDRQRLQRILRDLLSRTTEKVFLCHSDLAGNGVEQLGPLVTLVHAAKELSIAR
jgi:hypothetical protein